MPFANFISQNGCNCPNLFWKSRRILCGIYSNKFSGRKIKSIHVAVIRWSQKSVYHVRRKNNFAFDFPNSIFQSHLFGPISVLFVFYEYVCIRWSLENFFIVNWFSHFLATKKITLQPILFVNFGPPMHNNCFECTEMKWQKATKKPFMKLQNRCFAMYRQVQRHLCFKFSFLLLCGIH